MYEQGELQIVSLFLHISKVFGRILYNQVNNFMKNKLTFLLDFKNVILRSKKKKRKQRKKERVSKQKLLKGFHQGQNFTVLVILERLKFKTFSSPSATVAGNIFQCLMTTRL